MSRSQLREQICQKSDRQEWQSLVVLNGTNIFLNETNVSFLKFICGILNLGVANSFWNHVIQISSRQMHFQDIYFNLWKVKVLIGNIYSLKWNTYFCGTVMFVQDGFLYLIVTKHKLTVCATLTGTVDPVPRAKCYWGKSALYGQVLKGTRSHYIPDKGFQEISALHRTKVPLEHKCSPGTNAQGWPSAP